MAETIVDGLRVRSNPSISDDSHKYDPLLPLGTELYVLDGPVSASGYSWYEILPLTSRTLPRGWVASAGRDGEPWLAAGTFDCPPLPTDFPSLAALPKGVGLVCFPRVPITVQARLFDCNCDNTPGGFFTPNWFEMGAAHPIYLAQPKAARRPEWDDTIQLVLDATGQHPAVLPIGRYLDGTSWSQPAVVEVTGIYDHPAAASCTFTDWAVDDAKPVPTQECRLEFAVTRLVVKP